MTRDEFIEAMRKNRGRLTAKHTVANMEAIHASATMRFAQFMINTKKIGVDRAAEYTSRLDPFEQNDLLDWLDTKPSMIPVEEIDLKVRKIESTRKGTIV